MGKKKGGRDKGKGKNQDGTTSHQTAAVDSGDDECPPEYNVQQPVFTYNNKPHFPTNSTTSWHSTFKIELGEELYKVDEVSGNDVLCVSKYTMTLNELLRIRTSKDEIKLHGNIICVANLTRELCKGIVKAFEKLMGNSEEPMWLDSTYNYRLCGVEVYFKESQYPLVESLDNFSSPIDVIIIKDDQTQAPQRTPEAKFQSIRSILELVYPQNLRNKEWENMIGYLCKAKYRNDCCAGLPLSEHWLFWHWERRIDFIKYCHSQLVKEESHVVQLFSCAFDNMNFLDSNWESVFKADPALDKVWKHTTSSGIASQGGGSSNVAASSSISGGGGALSRSRREKGKKLIVKIRNCAEHVCEHRPTYNANGMYTGQVYVNINQTSPTDVYYKKRSYLPLRLLEKFPDLWNDLVLAVRNEGFQKY